MTPELRVKNVKNGNNYTLIYVVEVINCKILSHYMGCFLA